MVKNKALTEVQQFRLLRSLARGFQDGDRVDLSMLVTCVKGMQEPATAIQARRTFRACYSLAHALRQLRQLEESIFVLLHAIEVAERFGLVANERKAVRLLASVLVAANQKQRALQILRRHKEEKREADRKISKIEMQLERDECSSRRAPLRVDFEESSATALALAKRVISKQQRMNILGWS